MQWRNLWSMQRAVRAGLIAGAVSVLLWPIHAAWQEPVRPAFIAALAVTALAGVTIMVAVVSDIATVRRGRNAKRARVFDMALGLMLSLPTLAALETLLAR